MVPSAELSLPMLEAGIPENSVRLIPAHRKAINIGRGHLRCAVWRELAPLLILAVQPPLDF